jgi:hypothetical protein
MPSHRVTWKQFPAWVLMLVVAHLVLRAARADLLTFPLRMF